MARDDLPGLKGCPNDVRQCILIRKRVVVAALAAANCRDHKSGRSAAIDPERVWQIIAMLETGISKASMCRSYKVPRSTLLETLARVGDLDHPPKR